MTKKLDKIFKWMTKKCKYCDKIAKKTNRSSSLVTCGSSECLKKSHKNRFDKIEGLRRKNPKKILCELCSEEFSSIRPPHLKYCIDCVPNQTWRKRAGKYGIGKKQWDVILKKQYNTCALCDNEPTVVDHCHNENRVRGLLCHSCNINIMIFDKRDEFVKKAIKYTGKSYV